jgi:hypothetical protein
MTMGPIKFGVRAAVAAAVLATAGAAAAAGVVLPPHAGDNAASATSGVTLPADSHQSDANLGAAPESSALPNDHAAFGQCVAEQAKTASDNGGQGWQPVAACAGLKPSAPGSNAGLDTAGTHADDNASTGLSTAGAGAANGSAHANANGATHIPPH